MKVFERIVHVVLGLAGIPAGFIFTRDDPLYWEADCDRYIMVATATILVFAVLDVALVLWL